MKLKIFICFMHFRCRTFILSCADEFKDINSSEGDISTPNIRFLFTECLMTCLNRWIILHGIMIFRVLVLGGQCIVSPSGNDSFNLITEQGSTGSNIYDTLRMINDLRYQISQMSDEDKARYGYIQYL